MIDGRKMCCYYPDVACVYNQNCFGCSVLVDNNPELKTYNPKTHALYNLETQRVVDKGDDFDFYNPAIEKLIPKSQVGVEGKDAQELIDCHQGNPICMCETIDGECALDRLKRNLEQALKEEGFVNTAGLKPEPEGMAHYKALKEEEK